MRTAPLLLVALTACGYSFGTGWHEQGIARISLAVVGNATYRQRLEAELTEALARELPVATDLHLTTAAHADARLFVTLESVGERTLVHGSREDPVREGAMVARVQMRLVASDGRVLLERHLQDVTEYRSPIGETGATARAELVVDLARRIALALQTEPR